MNQPVCIYNGIIHTMEDITYESGYIITERGKIAVVGEGSPVKVLEKLYKSPKEVLMLDVEKGHVFPGLIEAHCHIGITEEKKGMAGDDCNETTTPMTPWLRAIDAINPMDSAFDDVVRAGITGVMVGPGSSNVVGGQFAFIKTKGRCLDDMIVKAPAAMKVAFGENPKMNYGNKDRMPGTRMAIAAMLREELFQAGQYLEAKKKAQNKNEDFHKDFRKEAWIPVLEKKIPLKAHVHRTDDILTAIRIAREFDLRMTLDHCTEGHLIAKEVAESGFSAICGPAMASRNKIEVQYADFKTPGELKKEGVTVAITTDHPVTLLPLLPYCAGLAAKKGLSIEGAWRAITIDAAKICGVEERVGSLKAGKDADIAVFDGNPLEIFTHTLYTMINGKLVWQAKKRADID